MVRPHVQPVGGLPEARSRLDHCYAEARNARFAVGTAVSRGRAAERRRRTDASRCNGTWRRDLCALIELTPNLNWLLLTKRIGNVFDIVVRTRSHDWLAGRDNAWLGATAVNQAEADCDIPKLLATPARASSRSSRCSGQSTSSGRCPATILHEAAAPLSASHG